MLSSLPCMRYFNFAVMLLAASHAAPAQSLPYYLPETSSHSLVLAPTSAFGLRVSTWRLDHDWSEAEGFLRSIDNCLTIQEKQRTRLDCITPTEIVTLMSTQGEILWSESQLDADEISERDGSLYGARGVWRTHWEGTVVDTQLEPGPLISVFRRYERMFDDASPWMLYEIFRGSFVLQNRLVSNGQKLTVHGWVLSSGMIQVITVHEDP